MDIAVDPLEGTELCANGLPNALAMIALSERGTMFDPGPCVYMKKMATSRDMAHLLDLDRPLPETLELMAKEKGVAVGDIVVIMLDRPRHEEAIDEIREAGARIRLIPHGDVSAALVAVTQGSPVDLLWGIGGTPEGVLAAAAIKCTAARSSAGCGRATTRSARPRSTPATTSTRCSTPTGWCPATTCFFSATGVTDGDMLDGVHFTAPRAPPPSRSSMRSRSGTVRTITARHDRAKLREITCANGSASAPARLRLRSGARRQRPTTDVRQVQPRQRAQEGVGHDHVDRAAG